ncbi:MAG: DUF58 domain-containing protein [Flavobacteriales bacterium]
MLIEIIILYTRLTTLQAKRTSTKVLSLGDDNEIKIILKSESQYPLLLTVFDELPFQFQERDFKWTLKINPDEEKVYKYTVHPNTRGEYEYGHINLHTSVLFHLCSRQIISGEAEMVQVVPSIIQMKKYELMAFASISTFSGIKKIRRIGHSYEFEQIKNYTQGDDMRSVNWKATSRRNSLMVNQYQDERSQQVYMIIDKSRNMHMPFHGLSLLDYAVNTSLVLSNIALKKHDKTGLITFSNRIGTTLPAEKGNKQLKKILHALYAEKPQEKEGDYDLLYRAVKNVIKSRSLIMLYLNFESMYAMERALPILQKINKQHLLVVMIFENTELNSYSHQKVEFVSDIYAQTIALKLLNEKKLIVSKLRKYGISTILSKPEDLSINSVNKYLELKAKGLI